MDDSSSTAERSTCELDLSLKPWVDAVIEEGRVPKKKGGHHAARLS
jgi:hypothetical protein